MDKRGKYFNSLQKSYLVQHHLNQKVKQCMAISGSKSVVLFQKTILIMDILHNFKILKQVDFHCNVVGMLQLGDEGFAVFTHDIVSIFNPMLEQLVFEFPAENEEQLRRYFYSIKSKEIFIFTFANNSIYISKLTLNAIYTKISQTPSLPDAMNIHIFSTNNQMVITNQYHDDVSEGKIEFMVFGLGSKGVEKKVRQIADIEFTRMYTKVIFEVDQQITLAGLNRLQEDSTQPNSKLFVLKNQKILHKLLESPYLISRLDFVNKSRHLLGVTYDYNHKQNQTQYDSLFVIINYETNNLLQRMPVNLNKLSIDPSHTYALDVLPEGKNKINIFVRFLYNKRSRYIFLLQKSFLYDTYGDSILQYSLSLLVAEQS